MISVDGRVTLAPGVNLMAGDARWEAATAGMGNPYDWVRRVHDPQVLLEGSGSFLSDASEGPAPDAGRPQRAEESESLLPAGVVEVAGQR